MSNMNRKPKRTNEIVHLSMKPLKNGCKRYFLDFSFEGKRYKEYLTNLTVKPANSTENRAYNKEAKLQAEAIRVERERQILEGSFGKEQANSRKYKALLLTDYLSEFKALKATKGQSSSNATTINNLTMHLIAYRGSQVKMSEVDKEFCNGFIDYLATAKAFKRNKLSKSKGDEKPLAKTTARLYYNTFVCALNRAAREGIIASNPANLIDREDKKPIKPNGEERAFLSTDEVKRLIAIPYTNNTVKRAFLFACFCGLRISDIRGLVWDNVKNENGHRYISVTMKKTGQTITVPLNSSAIGWMPKRGKANGGELVFSDLPADTTINSDLKKWAKEAGITKSVCFHVSRHTFATLSLEGGVGLAEVSALLGHQNIRTTQIYAKVVDKKKVEAVNLLDKMFNK